MECSLELSVFRFDAKTDQLPYYKKHFITIDKSKNVHDLLALIQAEDGSFDFPKGEYAALKINHRALFCDASLEKLISSCGKTLILEPLSTKRATKDLIINEDDFQRSFTHLEPYVEAKDHALFEQYKIYHYASPVHDFVEGFQGDALFAFAYDMIQKYPERKHQILQTIADEDNGIFLHVKLCKKIYPCGADVERKIVELKNEVIKQRPFTNALVEKLVQHIELL